MRRMGFLSVLVAAGALAMASAATAQTKIVYAGGPNKWANALGQKSFAGVNNFLINRITIHVGDTVDWNGASLASGFHTVDIPKLGGSDLPLIVPGAIVNGVNDRAGNPFWFNGHVPSLGFDPKLFAPIGGKTYNGKSRVDSGLPLGKPHDFKVKFTKVGKYNYFCDVHYGMHGQVIVKPKNAAIPTAKQDAATLKRAEKSYMAEAKRVDRTSPAANTVSVGGSGPGGLEVFAMFPAVLTVSPGTTVRFVMSKDTRETHTASFGPKPYLAALAHSFNGPAPAPAAVYPSDPPGSISLSPTSHGNGFANVGAMDRDSTTPQPAFGAIKFTTAGTYNYMCLVHPFMHGEIIVK